MAFTDKKGMDGSDYTSMIVVGIVTAIILYLLVAVNYDRIAKQIQDLKTFDVQEPPPPPEKLPPPPPKQDLPPPPVVSPPSIIRTNIPPPPQTTSVPNAPPAPFNPTPAPPAPPAAAPPPPPPPPPALPAVRATPKGNPGSWASSEDYPSGPLREGVEGTTGFRLEIGTDGRVVGCSITRSSGSGALDDTTCKLMTRRGRFSPAKDTSGNPVPGNFSSNVRWQIPK